MNERSVVFALVFSGGLFACGGGGSSDLPPDGAQTGDAAGPPHASPPAPGPMTAPDGPHSAWVISKLYLGDTQRDGTPDRSDGWKGFGYDLDGKISTMASTDLCKPAQSAVPKNVYPDGVDGTDNSFGKNILPIVLGLSSDASSKVNAQIAAGEMGLIFDISKLGTGSDYNPVMVQYYVGTSLGSTPKFDGTDAWPLAPEQLVNPSDAGQGSKVQFPTSYLVGNTLVVQGQGEIALSLPSDGGASFAFPLVIKNPIVTFTLSADHQSATKGTIAGVLDTQELVSALRLAAGALDPSLCSGPTIDSITTQIEQASDILADGTQDPTKTCSGISIGLGFDVAPVMLGAIGPETPLTPDPCE